MVCGSEWVIELITFNGHGSIPRKYYLYNAHFYNTDPKEMLLEYRSERNASKQQIRKKCFQTSHPQKYECLQLVFASYAISMLKT